MQGEGREIRLQTLWIGVGDGVNGRDEGRYFGYGIVVFCFLGA
jgi:hypothetical protein